MDGAIRFDQSVRDSVDNDGKPLPHPMRKIRLWDWHSTHQAKRVRSIQRLPLPEGWAAKALSRAYTKWISRATLGLIREVHMPDGRLDLCLLSPRRVLIELTPTPFSLGCTYRRAYYITGGLLVKNVDPPGRFELRIFPTMGLLITALHGYKPRLPWWLYSISQATIHVLAMHAFGRSLRRIQRRIQSNSKS
jgi:hypothetical protein